MKRYLFIFLLLLLPMSHVHAIPKTTLMREDIGYCNVFDGQPTAALTGATIAARITALAGARCTLYLAGAPGQLPGQWIISTPLVIPDTITLVIPDGTTVTGAGNLTIARLLASTKTGWYIGTGVLTITTYLYGATNYFPMIPVTGAICNGTGDQSGVINAAIALIPATGGTVLLPPGTCRITQALSPLPAKGILLGQGRQNTIISIETATATAITLSGDYAAVRDLTLTGVSRTTGIGVLTLNTGQFYVIEGVFIDHQGIGIKNGGAGTEIRNLIVDHCVSHGIYLDGDARAQDEVRVINVQSNVNGGDGLRMLGGPANASGAGIRIDKFTSVANTGIGLNSIAGTSGWSIGAVWVTDPELSTNSKNLVVGTGLNNLFWTLQGGLYEAAGAENIVLNGSNHTIRGAIIDAGGRITPASGHGISLIAGEVVIANNVILSNAGAGLIFGAGSADIVVANNVIRNNTTGIQFVAGSAIITIVGGRLTLNGTAIVGTIPADVNIIGVGGIANRLVDLQTTGAAGGKAVVCADANGQLFKSSTGTDCSN